MNVKGIQIINHLYNNPLSDKSCVHGFQMEGMAAVTFSNNAMQMENILDPNLGQKANFVYWCPETFPKDIMIQWDFKPLHEPGLCMLFFAGMGRGGEDLFDPKLNPRNGEYKQYHSGDINAFHVSYFRRKNPDERMLHTCNLRKSFGFHLVAQGPDPIPSVEDAAIKGFYKIRLIKIENEVSFYIEDLHIFTYVDDGITNGTLLGEGKIGFRQMAPLLAEYANLNVYQIGRSS